MGFRLPASCSGIDMSEGPRKNGQPLPLIHGEEVQWNMNACIEATLKKAKSLSCRVR